MTAWRGHPKHSPAANSDGFINVASVEPGAARGPLRGPDTRTPRGSRLKRRFTEEKSFKSNLFKKICFSYLISVAVFTRYGNMQKMEFRSSVSRTFVFCHFDGVDTCSCKALSLPAVRGSEVSPPRGELVVSG